MEEFCLKPLKAILLKNIGQERLPALVRHQRPFKNRMLFNLGVKFLMGRVSSLRSLSENGILRNVVDTDGHFLLLFLLTKIKMP